MTYPSRAQAATSQPVPHKPPSDPDLTDPAHMLSHMPHARVEEHLRNFLIADAAGVPRWEGEEAGDAHDKWQSAGRQIGAALPKDQMAIYRDFYFGGIGLGAMSETRAATLAVIGSGVEAEIQILAALRKRRFSEIRIYSRQPVAAASLAKKIRKEQDLTVRVAASPEEAVLNANVIILASGETKPVIFAEWVSSNAHITCAFAQQISRCEIDQSLLARSKVVASDSPYAIGDDPQHLVTTLPARRRVIHIGAMLDRFEPDRNRGITVFLLSGSQELNLPTMQAIAAARQD